MQNLLAFIIQNKLRVLLSVHYQLQLVTPSVGGASLIIRINLNTIWHSQINILIILFDVTFVTFNSFFCFIYSVQAFFIFISV